MMNKDVINGIVDYYEKRQQLIDELNLVQIIQDLVIAVGKKQADDMLKEIMRYAENYEHVKVEVVERLLKYI